MKATQLKKLDTGEVQVSGTLGFTDVAALLKTSMGLFDGQVALVFDLERVEKTDSAGLALLLEWMTLARKSGQSITFKKIPKQMLEIAHVSGLEEILPVV
ncbi:MAG: STAS domain-containing protein [Cycloclasticus sp.]|nr:STAS domain-containing protein [Cycloclasticus sp.]